MYLPSLVVLVAVAAGEGLAPVPVPVVYHLTIPLKVHNRNLRPNSIEHREIVGSSLFFLPWTGGLPFFFTYTRFFFFVYARIIVVCWMFVNMFHTICITLFSSPWGILFLFWFVVFVSHRSVTSHLFFNNLCLGTLDHSSEINCLHSCGSTSWMMLQIKRWLSKLDSGS